MRMQSKLAEIMPTDAEERWRGRVFWTLVAIVLGSALALGGNRPAAWLALSAGSLLLLLPSAGSTRSAGPLRHRTWPLALGILGVAGWAVLQTVSWLPTDWRHPVWSGLTAGTVSAEPDATLAGVVRLLGYAAVFWVAAWSMGRPGRSGQLIDVVALFSGALALFGLCAWVIGVNPIVGEPAYPGSVTASYVSRNSYAFYAGLGAMCCVAAVMTRLPASAWDARAGARRAMRDTIEMLVGRGLVFVIALVIILSAMLLTGSRAGVVSAICGLLFVLVICARGLAAPVRRAVLAGLAVLVGALVLAAPEFTSRLLGADPVDGMRLAVYGAVIEGISDRPWLGHGLGTFQTAFRPHVPMRAAAAEWDLAHNTYLENAFELGLPAAALLLGILLVISARLWRASGGSRQDRAVVAVALGALLAGGLHSLVDFSLQMPASAALFALLLGAAWGTAVRAEGRSGKRRSPKRT